MFNYGIDAVVRHPASKSPTKIIAMVSGLVASYSYRRGSDKEQEDKSTIRVADSTVTISQYTSNSGKDTYVTSHREMIYQQTASYNPNDGTGKIGVNLNGFDGFINLDQDVYKRQDHGAPERTDLGYPAAPLCQDRNIKNEYDYRLSLIHI